MISASLLLFSLLSTASAASGPGASVTVLAPENIQGMGGRASVLGTDGGKTTFAISNIPVAPDNALTYTVGDSGFFAYKEVASKVPQMGDGVSMTILGNCQLAQKTIVAACTVSLDGSSPQLDEMKAEVAKSSVMSLPTTGPQALRLAPLAIPAQGGELSLAITAPAGDMPGFGGPGPEAGAKGPGKGKQSRPAEVSAMATSSSSEDSSSSTSVSKADTTTSKSTSGSKTTSAAKSTSTSKAGAGFLTVAVAPVVMGLGIVLAL